MAKSVPMQSYLVWGWLRIGLGLIFLWAFFDKLFGLGFSTCRADSGAVDVMCDKAWLSGGSPTTGFLKFGTDGPFANFYQGLAGNTFVDWLFMLGLLGIGVGLLFGIAVKIAATAGVVLLLMMWSAVLPPEHHPFLDEHIIYAIALVGICVTNPHQKLGFGKQWAKLSIVQKYPFLA